MQQLTSAKLFERRGERLRLQWICGDLERFLTDGEADVSPADLVGHLNLIHPERLQVLCPCPRRVVIPALEILDPRRHRRERIGLGAQRCREDTH